MTHMRKRPSMQRYISTSALPKKVEAVEMLPMIPYKVSTKATTKTARETPTTPRITFDTCDALILGDDKRLGHMASPT